MSDLYTNLELINLEKTQKIIPENIKSGVTILGVEGTLEAGNADYSGTITPTEYASCLDLATDIISAPEYTPLDYVYNNGQVELDTEIVLKSTDKFEIVFEHYGTAIDYERLFGTANSEYSFIRWVDSSSNPTETYKFYTDNETYKYVLSKPVTDEGKHTVLMNAGKGLLLDGETVISSYQSVDSTSTMRLWHQSDRYGNYKIYSVKVWDKKDNLINQIIPCKDIEGTICMFDIFTQQFLYPSTGELKYDE